MTTPRNHNKHSEADVLAMLSHVACTDHDMWFKIGAALYSWDPGSLGRSVFGEWASGFHDDVKTDSTWKGYAKPHKGKAITIGSIVWLAKQGGWKTSEWREAAQYIYCEAGTNYHRVKRLIKIDKSGNDVHKPDGKAKKSFPIEHWANGAWASGDGDLKRVLYKSDLLKESLAAGKTILWVEGEKCVEKLIEMGFSATTSMAGAGDKKNFWKRAYPRYFKAGDKVVVLPDQDNEGALYANNIGAGLAAAGVAVGLLQLDRLAEKQDIVEWFDELGGTVPQLTAYVENAPRWEPMQVDPSPERPDTNVNWRERYKSEEPKASLHNAKLAINAIGLICRLDTFHNRVIFDFGDKEVTSTLKRVMYDGLSDDGILVLRMFLSDTFGFDLTRDFVNDAVRDLAIENSFDPVAEMLNEAEQSWDGVSRLDNMANVYLNAEDTPLNSTCLRKWMIAAIARVREPGCKFDNILVLESKEGWDKSKFFQTLAGEPENFSDEAIIGKDSKIAQENLGGIWIHENAELSGMKKTDVDMVKAFASRQVDRARPAYGRHLISQPRHSIEGGSTNNDTWLPSQTGNRRFWPIKLLKPVNIEAFARDRLQLLGEAAYYQRQRESLLLSEDLWASAADEQEKRRNKDPWEDILANMPETVNGSKWNNMEGYEIIKIIHRNEIEEMVVARDLLTYVLLVPMGQQQHSHTMRLSVVMKQLGWEKPNKIIIGEVGKKIQVNGYLRRLKLI